MCGIVPERFCNYATVVPVAERAACDSAATDAATRRITLHTLRSARMEWQQASAR
jgi:hypothetical protein